jgi:hypothetical protein
MTMTPHQRELARHALGLPNKKRTSYRNRFATDAGPDNEAWRRMVDADLAKMRPGVEWMGGMDAFWLTTKGAEMALDQAERLSPEDFPDVSR